MSLAVYCFCVDVWNRGTIFKRRFSTAQTDGEKRITYVLLKCFPGASVEVNDISGGCGDMYEIHIKSEDFAGKKQVQQHKMVTSALKSEIQQMHGLRIFTSVPENT